MGSAAPTPTANLDTSERPKPSEDRRQPYLTPEQAAQTIAAATEPCRTLFRLLDVTGARVSEALALRWQDIYTDGDDPRIALNGQVDRHGERHPLKRRENGVGRVVPITATLAAELRAHADRAGTPGEYVFASRTGRPLGQRNVQRSLRAAMTRARTPEGGPSFPALHGDEPVARGTLPGCHGFRHGRATAEKTAPARLSWTRPGYLAHATLPTPTDPRLRGPRRGRSTPGSGSPCRP